VPLFTDKSAQPPELRVRVQTVDDLGGKSTSMVLASIAVRPPHCRATQCLLHSRQKSDGTMARRGRKPLKVNLYRYHGQQAAAAAILPAENRQ
jgi:hypothetical protein